MFLQVSQAFGQGELPPPPTSCPGSAWQHVLNGTGSLLLPRAPLGSRQHYLPQVTFTEVAVGQGTPQGLVSDSLPVAGTRASP